MQQHDSKAAMSGSQAEIWVSAPASPRARLDRPDDVPRPTSVDEVAKWAGSEDLRNTALIYAPVFWVLLPLAAIGFLIYQTATDPTGAEWSITINGESRDSWPAWVPWLAWIGVCIWLLIAVGVLLLRSYALAGVRVENGWIYAHGVAHSIHRTSFDRDDGDGGGWATYIALDHRLGDQQAARIHAAFERWLSQEGLPPSGAEPISSATLFGTGAVGGYFILHLPVSHIAGATAEQRWMLISPPQDGEGDVIVTPVPVPKKRERIRRKLERKAGRGAS